MPTDDRSLVLVGRAEQEGNIEILESFLSSGQESTEAPADSRFTLAFAGKEGQLLDEAPFAVSFETPHIPFPLFTAGFTVVRPLPAGTAAVQLRFEGRVLTTLERAESTPVVQKVRVQSLESGDLEIEWDMAALEDKSGRLTAALALSYDGAEPWLPLYSGLREPRFTLAVDGLGASEAAVIRVTVSDGFETAEAFSEPFSLPGAAPAAVILAPSLGALLRAKEEDVLRGAALDAREGLLPDDALQWRLRTGAESTVLGTGSELLARLPEGDQVIELSVTNAAGRRSVVERPVTVSMSTPVLRARRRLRVVGVSAMDAVSSFSTTGSVTAVDEVGDFVVAGKEGLGRLQSRTWPAGMPEARAVGLTAYLYRVVLSGLIGDPAVDGVSAVRLPFGEVEPVEFGSQGPSDAFVLTEGALGSVMPSSVELDEGGLVIFFDPPVRAGVKAGAGEESLFIGIASSRGPGPAQAIVVDLAGGEHRLAAQAPA